MKTLQCKSCKADFVATSLRATYCSDKCKLHNRFLVAQQRLRSSGVEGVDYVIDLWNGYATPRIYGKWMLSMHPGKTTADYLAEFPNAPLCCEKDKKSTSVNSGKHMKDPKYRNMAREAMLGDRNPNHSTKTTLIERQKRSPFSSNFAYYDNPEEAREFQLEHCHKGLNTTHLQYWINLGYDEMEATELLKERQATFSLEKCIARHGIDEGTRIFNDRNKKWSALVESKYKNGEFSRFCKHNWSNIEAQFVNALVASLGIDASEYSSCINGKQFFRHFKDVGLTKAYDFVLGRKIIEFNGDYWHCNPKIYEADYFNRSIGCTASDKWKLDQEKIDLIEREGYKVLTVWEQDWNQDPDSVLAKCIEFLHD